MTYAIVDCRMTADIRSAVSEFADEIIELPPHPQLASPVASHPDMLLWIYGKHIVTYRDYAKLARKPFCKLSALGYEIIYTEDSPSAEYPKDVSLNCAVVGNRLICNEKYLSKAIKRIAAEHGLELINVKQGYAKCSTVTVGENAIITQDPSIYKAATAHGIDALKISDGGVALRGYDTGFIGGASGALCSHVVFCGNLSLHADGEKISTFCQTHGKQALSLSHSPLYDYGTVFFV